MSVVIHCELRLKPNTRAQLAQEIREAALESLVKTEQGNIDYRFLAPLNDEDSLWILEEWDTEDSINVHRQGENVRLWHQIADKYIVGRAHRKYHAEPVV